MQRYDVGDKVRVFVQFKDLSGNKAEPTAVAAAFKTPAGVTTQVAGGDITHDLSIDPETLLAYVGRYYIDVTFTEGSESVPWWVRYEGEGAVVAAQEQPFWVRVPNVVIP